MLKKNRLLILSFIVFAISMVLTSCLDNDYDTPVQAHGDALVRVFYEGDSLVYGLQFFTYSNTEMKSVKAYHENSSAKVSLDSTEGAFTFAYTPPRDSYSTDKPEEGRYFFDVVFESGHFVTLTDYLYSQTLNPPDISMVKPEVNTGNLTVSWIRDLNAQYYKVALLDESRSVLFETPLLDNYHTNYIVTADAYGWYDDNTFVQGEEYRLIVNAYLFEPMASSLDIQCIATNDLQTFIWE